MYFGAREKVSQRPVWTVRSPLEEKQNKQQEQSPSSAKIAHTTQQDQQPNGSCNRYLPVHVFYTICIQVYPCQNFE